MPYDLKSQFTGCNFVALVRHHTIFSTRVKEHLLTDKNSHVQKYLITSPDCKQKRTPSCFTIIDSARDAYSLRLKGAIYISRLKPEVNVQLQHNSFCFL